MGWPLGCDRGSVRVHSRAHGGLCGRLWLSCDLAISLEQEIADIEPYTRTQEAELNSGSVLVCSTGLATFLCHCVPKPSLSGGEPHLQSWVTIAARCVQVTTVEVAGAPSDRVPSTYPTLGLCKVIYPLTRGNGFYGRLSLHQA